MKKISKATAVDVVKTAVKRVVKPRAKKPTPAAEAPRRPDESRF